mmetsp:Transcript_97603/g.223683  ORF Transcript_97603/g.223683 Transcript_97603/m.223683 type:complete len:209 (+) Transcript_97603:105-731(+)
MKRYKEGRPALKTMPWGAIRITWAVLARAATTLSSFFSWSPRMCTSQVRAAFFGALCSASISGTPSSSGPRAGVRLMLKAWARGHISTGGSGWRKGVGGGVKWSTFSSAHARAWAILPVYFMGSAPLWRRLLSMAARRRRTTEEKQTLHPRRLALITRFTRALTPLASTAGTVSKSSTRTFNCLSTSCSWISMQTVMAVPKKKYPVSQ